MERDLFERAPVPTAYMKLAVPVVLSMVLGVVYNMVDTWFISLTGDADLVAGVSVCAPVFVLSTAMGDIWGLGGSSVISRLLGQKQDIKAGGLSAFCLYSGTTLMNDHMSGDFPVLKPGQNAVSWSGNVTRVIVRLNWRYL